MKPIALWIHLHGDPYSCCLCPGNMGYHHAGAYYRLRLLDQPDDIVAFMAARLPGLTPVDWWWVNKQDKFDSWIEVAIRETAVLANCCGD